MPQAEHQGNEEHGDRRGVDEADEMEADEVEEQDADVTGEGGETSGLFAAFLKLKAFLVDLARKHVAHGPETEPHKQHAHGDEDEGDDGWEKGRADGRGQGFDDPLIDVAVKIDEKEHEEEADARFDPDVSP